jgi:hypothetical protein
MVEIQRSIPVSVFHLQLAAIYRATMERTRIIRYLLFSLLSSLSSRAPTHTLSPELTLVSSPARAAPSFKPTQKSAGAEADRAS